MIGWPIMKISRSEGTISTGEATQTPFLAPIPRREHTQAPTTSTATPVAIASAALMNRSLDADGLDSTPESESPS